jgi:hypothetical protein
MERQTAYRTVFINKKPILTLVMAETKVTGYKTRTRQSSKKLMKFLKQTLILTFLHLKDCGVFEIWRGGKLSEQSYRKEQEDGKNYTTNSFIVCVTHQILSA